APYHIVLGMPALDHGKISRRCPSWVHEQTPPLGQSPRQLQSGFTRELPGPVRSAPDADITAYSIGACARRVGTRTRMFFAFYSPAFHFASGQISGTSLPLCVQGSTVQSSLVLRSLITAVLCGPSVNRNRDTGAAIVWCRSNLSWSRTSRSEFVLLVVSMQSN